MLEFDSIYSFKGSGEDIPEYLKKNLMTVNSGLYIVFFSKEGVVRCNYCWYTPKVVDNSNLCTLISSAEQLSTLSMMHFTKLLDNYNNPNKKHF